MWQRTKNLYHLCVAVLATTYYLFPARKLKIIGVTGTDGKTTTTSLIYHLLKSAGRNVSLISTVAAYIGDKTYETGLHVTNPAPVSLQRFLKKIAVLGTGKETNYLVLEVTSHGIDQNRIWGIPFTISVLTNVTHEHLDYHKTYDNYFFTKAKFLKKGKIVVLNKDDASFEKMKQLMKKNAIMTYSVHADATVTPKTVPYTCALPNSFQQHNELAAITVCLALGLTHKEIQSGLASFMLPKGRVQIVYDKDFQVMIDFAHTPNAFKELLSTLRPKIQGRIIHVFGSAGQRDKTKRPLMGEYSASYADMMVLTAEDPRGESVQTINKEIIAGIRELDKKRVIIFEVPQRNEAIEKAIEMARKNDLVLITGKAHEQSINYSGKEEPWDEFEAVNNAVQKREHI